MKSRKEEEEMTGDEGQEGEERVGCGRGGSHAVQIFLYSWLVV